MVKITQQLRKWQSCEEMTLNVPFLFLRCSPKREEGTHTNTYFNLHKVVYTQTYVCTHTHTHIGRHTRTCVSHRYSLVLTKTERALHTCTVTLTHQTYTNIQILTPSHADTHTHTTHTIAHTPIPEQAERPKGLKQLEKNPASSRVCPRDWNGILRRQGPWEKNNQAVSVNTVAHMLTGSGPRGLGSALSPRVGVKGSGRSRLPGATSQPDPGAAWPELWFPGTR